MNRTFWSHCPGIIFPIVFVGVGVVGGVGAGIDVVVVAGAVVDVSAGVLFSCKFSLKIWLNIEKE